MIRTKIESIGKLAHEVLASAKIIKINGITSRGLFLNTDTRWVLFASFEKFQGPLTINIPASKNIFSKTQRGETAFFKNNILTFPHSKIEIGIDSAKIRIPSHPGKIEGQYSKAEIITRLTTENDPLLNSILDPSSHIPLPDLDRKILEVFLGMQKEGSGYGLDSLVNLLGLGKGLTPECDDFIIGFLFSLHHKYTNIGEVLDKDQIKFLIQNAYTHTTQISANLIECAANGQADERLHAAYQALNNQLDEYSNPIKNLLAWGNTSGRMALIGITAGILIQMQH